MYLSNITVQVSCAYCQDSSIRADIIRFYTINQCEEIVCSVRRPMGEAVQRKSFQLSVHGYLRRKIWIQLVRPLPKSVPNPCRDLANLLEPKFGLRHRGNQYTRLDDLVNRTLVTGYGAS